MTDTRRRAPDGLDGPVADPDHHHVLFENDEVRVVETRIPAGVRSPVLPRVQWSDGTPAHTLENTGSDELHVIGVELKGGEPAG